MNASPKRSCLGISLALLGTGLSGLCLSNLTFGVVEIPDNLPFVGNLDEVLASAILFSCLSYLGINVVPSHWSRRLPAAGAKRPDSPSDRVITATNASAAWC
jgi:hypothetical protein